MPQRRRRRVVSSSVPSTEQDPVRPTELKSTWSPVQVRQRRAFNLFSLQCPEVKPPKVVVDSESNVPAPAVRPSAPTQSGFIAFWTQWTCGKSLQWALQEIVCGSGVQNERSDKEITMVTVRALIHRH